MGLETLRVLASSDDDHYNGTDHGHHGHHSIPEGSISIILSCTIVGVLVLQGATRWLERLVEGNRHAADVLNVVFRELTVMGVIAFILFTSQWSGVLHLNSHDKHIFEIIHISLFLIALLLVAWTCGLYVILRRLNSTFEAFEITEVDAHRDNAGQTKHDRLMARYHEIEQQLEVEPLSEHSFFGSFWVNGLLRHPLLWFEYHKLLSVVRYHDIRRNFLRSHHLPPNFPFARYLQKCEQKVCLKLTEISPTTWFVVVVFVTLDLYFLGVSGDEIMQDPNRLNVVLSLIALTVSLTVFFKVSWIFWYVLHSEFLYFDPEYSHTGEETAIVGVSHQRELFWFDNPGIVVTMISFVQFLQSVCATLLMVLSWDYRSYIALGCLLGSSACFFTLLPHIVSQFTIVISVGEMSNVPSILHIVHKLKEGPEHDLWDHWLNVHASHLKNAEAAQEAHPGGGVAHLEDFPLRASLLRWWDRTLNQYVNEEALQMKTRACLVLCFLFVVALEMNHLGDDERLEQSEIVFGVLMWLESAAVAHVSVVHGRTFDSDGAESDSGDKSIYSFLVMDLCLCSFCLLVVLIHGTQNARDAVVPALLSTRTLKVLHALTGAAGLLRMVPEIMTFIRHHQHTIEEEHHMRLIGPDSKAVDAPSMRDDHKFNSDDRVKSDSFDFDRGDGIQLTNLDQPTSARRRSTSGASASSINGTTEVESLDGLQGGADGGAAADTSGSPKAVRLLARLDSSMMETGPGSGSFALGEGGFTSEEEFDYEKKYTTFYNHVLLEGHMWRAMQPHGGLHSRSERRKQRKRKTRQSSLRCIGSTDPKEFDLNWSLVHFVLTRDQILYYKMESKIPVLAAHDTVRLETARQRASSRSHFNLDGACESDHGEDDIIIGPDRSEVPHPLGRVHLNTIRHMHLSKSGTQLSLECGSLTLHLRSTDPQGSLGNTDVEAGQGSPRHGSGGRGGGGNSPTASQDVDLDEWKEMIQQAIHDEADEDFVDFYTPHMRTYTQHDGTEDLEVAGDSPRSGVPPPPPPPPLHLSLPRVTRSYSSTPAMRHKRPGATEQLREVPTADELRAAQSDPEPLPTLAPPSPTGTKEGSALGLTTPPRSRYDSDTLSQTSDAMAVL